MTTGSTLPLIQSNPVFSPSSCDHKKQQRECTSCINSTVLCYYLWRLIIKLPSLSQLGSSQTMMVWWCSYLQRASCTGEEGGEQARQERCLRGVNTWGVNWTMKVRGSLWGTEGHFLPRKQQDWVGRKCVWILLYSTGSYCIPQEMWWRPALRHWEWRCWDRTDVKDNGS